jgi:uncharacterized protein involved in exopolysaccharide biosynthesis
MDSAASPRTSRWKRVILIPTLVGLLTGFLVSYAFAPKYTSESLVMVERQKLPGGLVAPIVQGDLAERVSFLQSKTLSRSHLIPLVKRLGLEKDNRSADAVISDIQSNISIEPITPDWLDSGKGKGEGPGRQENSMPGFTVVYVASNPEEAKTVCNEITAMLISENITSREASIDETLSFLQGQVDAAAQQLRELDGHPKRDSSSHPDASVTGPSTALERDAARKSYGDLLSKLSHAQVEVNLAKDSEAVGLGERWVLLNPAPAPEDPVFPDRVAFALGGSAVGLLLGLGIFLRLKLARRKAVLLADSIPEESKAEVA